MSVYKFRDQTGQYKYHPTATTFSTAITQGATSMLIKALEDSGWFIPVEREGLPDLLTERKIVRATRNQYDKNNELPGLPPLMYAGLLLEGGIIAYETNIVTGGFGARYFGIGGSVEYRRDSITIYLRAVSIKNGKVLKSVMVRKVILSREIDLGVYRFIRFKRLLEAETGLSYNEPTQMCVLEAIEKAVFSLIVEGIIDGFWQLENKENINSPIIKKYLKERESIEKRLYFDKEGNLIKAKDIKKS